MNRFARVLIAAAATAALSACNHPLVDVLDQPDDVPPADECIVTVVDPCGTIEPPTVIDPPRPTYAPPAVAVDVPPTIPTESVIP